MMDGPSPIRPSSPDWRHTHTAAKPTTISNPSTQQHSPVDVKPHASLPSLAYLDFAKIRNNGQHTGPKQLSPITTTTASITPSLHSPAGGYPGPPPPYSASMAAPASNTGSTFDGYVSQPEPRRTFEEEKDRDRQSLPSIHEALGKDSAPLARGPPYSGPIQPPGSIMTAPSPTTPIHPRSHAGSFSSHPPNPYESHNQPQPHQQQHHQSLPIPPPPPTSSSISKPIEAPARPTLDFLQRETRVEDARRYAPQEPSPARYIPNSPHVPGRTQAPSHSSTPSFFGNSFSGHSFSQPAPPPPPGSSSSSYATSCPPAYSYPPPQSYPGQQAPASTWRGHEFTRPEYDREEDDRRGPPHGGPAHTNPSTSGQRSPGPYHHGESVKRHLETFDLELGLNEIAAASTQTLDFARKYMDKAHHMQRAGISTALPSLVECDEMYKLQRSMLSSMDRIREIVVAQQAALAEQKSREDAGKARQNSYGDDGHSLYEKDEGSGGFAGSDPKKRRGRHAPPGRCHSCARSETPEWRRGPDGARTLCNACGLHYAKLTRKLGPKAALGGSNLRPKDDGEGVP